MVDEFSLRPSTCIHTIEGTANTHRKLIFISKLLGGLEQWSVVSMNGAMR